MVQTERIVGVRRTHGRTLGASPLNTQEALELVPSANWDVGENDCPEWDARRNR